MEKMLQVKNLRISFRTQGGTLKAVRDISFDLERGETLAIVGESGSGKSVTSKAILGILAGNSIVEGGEILFDGKDLLKIDEEDMHKIRGDKIAMIFQDPLSSLNPIVKIGRQITEAMLLKNKLTRRVSRKEFNAMLALLKKHMTEVFGAEKAAEIEEKVTTFDKFNVKAIELETAFNEAYTHAEELVADIEDVVFLLERKQKLNLKERLGEIVKTVPRTKNLFFPNDVEEKIARECADIAEIRGNYNADDADAATKLIKELRELEDSLNVLLALPRPNFFRIGYYAMTNPEADLTAMPVEQLNEMTLKYLDDNFMKDFIEMETAGVEHSFRESIEAKRAVLAALPEVRAFFAEGNLDKKASYAKAKYISDLVIASIDRLATVKDSATYTFPTALDDVLGRYFHGVVNNPREEARFAKQTAKREALIARGKTVDWKVVPKSLYDLDALLAELLKLLDTLAARFEREIAEADSMDMLARSITLIDYLKDKASSVVYKLTKRIAKEKAIKLMDEVGIPDSRIRYNQYPFEFSGGMRQRIVIAIALSANPDILICDEPTTALDVTIQAQILELINNLKRERNLSVIFITHDLGVVANVADKIAVMYAGKIVEYGTADDLFYDPRHPYTWALLSSMPDLDTEEKLDAIPGTPPNMIYPPVGDAFADRNKYALKIDFEQQPPQFEVSPTHWAATWLLHPDAPKVEPPHIITDRIERMKKRGGAENE